MKRIILTCPSGLTFDQLTQEQQDAVNSVFAQYVMPIPGTKEFNGKILIDAVTGDNFDPATIQPLGLPFEVIANYQWDGVSTTYNEIITALDSNLFLSYLEDIKEYDSEGNLVSSTAPTVAFEPHRFGGWPAII